MPAGKAPQPSSRRRTWRLLQIGPLIAMIACASIAEAKRNEAALETTADLGKPGDVVRFLKPYPMGSIVIVNDERRLYYVLGGGRAIRYPIAIGTSDEIWTGRTFVQSKVKDPVWKPPWNPESEVPGGPNNPLGERAIYLDWSLYRIHGTNAPGSIGRSASHGCFRMHNHNVKDLYERVHIGAPVYVVNAIDDPLPARRQDKPPDD